METWLTWSHAAAVTGVPEPTLKLLAEAQNRPRTAKGVLVRLDALQLPLLRRLQEQQRKRAA